MASIQTLERRLAALEARLADIEGGYGESLYTLRREAIRSRIETGSILSHLGLARATDDQIDAAMDDEQ